MFRMLTMSTVVTCFHVIIHYHHEQAVSIDKYKYVNVQSCQ